MNKQILLLAAVMTTGTLTGVIVSQRTPPGNSENVLEPDAQVSARQAPQTSKQNDNERLLALENTVLTLTSRLEAIEATQDFGLPKESRDVPTSFVREERVDARRGSGRGDRLSSRRGNDSVTDNLVAVGIDNFTADTIGREQNDLALRRLELRDKAVRANYFDSDRYRDELQILNDATKSIRQEVGDEFYDRYLYASRQPNRLRISSVMTTSAAESAGISDGDVLVSYAAQRIFSLGDLQASTSQGVRNEPVGITVIRGDREMSLTISRGPLGVQLIPTRVDPANQ